MIHLKNALFHVIINVNRLFETCSIDMNVTRYNFSIYKSKL